MDKSKVWESNRTVTGAKLQAQKVVNKRDFISLNYSQPVLSSIFVRIVTKNHFFPFFLPLLIFFFFLSKREEAESLMPIFTQTIMLLLLFFYYFKQNSLIKSKFLFLFELFLISGFFFCFSFFFLYNDFACPSVKIFCNLNSIFVKQPILFANQSLMNTVVLKF